MIDCSAGSFFRVPPFELAMFISVVVWLVFPNAPVNTITKVAVGGEIL